MTGQFCNLQLKLCTRVLRWIVWHCKWNWKRFAESGAPHASRFEMASDSMGLALKAGYQIEWAIG